MIVQQRILDSTHINIQWMINHVLRLLKTRITPSRIMKVGFFPGNGYDDLEDDDDDDKEIRDVFNKNFLYYFQHTF